MYRLKLISNKISTIDKTMIKVPIQQAEEVFNNLVSQQTKCIILFTGQPNDQGVNWCPDCQNIAPLYPTFEQQCKSHGLPFYVFLVGDRPTWKNPEHFFRKNKLTRVNNVPTMALFDGKKVSQKLNDDKEIENAKNREMLFE